MQHIRIESQNELAILWFDRQDSSVNKIDSIFVTEFDVATTQLKEMKPKGVILRSAKSTFFAGGDLDMLFQCTQSEVSLLFGMVESLKTSIRRLETMGIPVVACIDGSALGGGWELALGAHHRIMLNHPKVQIGLPEVTLGLLPGGGGVARTVRIFGLQEALPLLTEGKKYTAEKALNIGLIHEIVDSSEDLLKKAIEWIHDHPQAEQLWDKKGYRLPGGSPASPKLAPLLAIAPAMVRKKTKGVYPAPEVILATMVEGALVDFETACRIESRYFVHLVCHPVAKNMISAFWYQLNEISSGVGRPKGQETRKFNKVGILGAGMMGAGIAFAASKSGCEVVLKDVSNEQAEKGKNYSQQILEKLIKKGYSTSEKAENQLALIHPTADASDFAGCDLVIEAVFEDRQLKAKVMSEVDSFIEKDALLASNTSTLPITGLAQNSSRPADFIGLHFFSPVDKMKLVEIISGKETSHKL